jgi:N utilization substance protein A
MNTEFFNALDLLEKEKGIPKEYMFEKVEAALVTAFKKEKGNNSMVRIVLDPNKKDVRVYEQWNIVEEVTDPQTEISLEDAKKMNRRYVLGGVAEAELKTKTFGRISAQTAKQVIIQGIREAERGMMLKEYEDKQESIVSAKVISVDPDTGNALLDLGTSRATLLHSEQIPGEILRPDEYVKVYVMEVRKESSRGPLVTLSRTHPGLLRRLFETEVPEIADGTVVIENIAREAGRRSKIAVRSTDENVDPVGACIGNHGMRISRIVDELCGERIDVIKYSEDPEEFIASALSPAVVDSVEVSQERDALVYVAADQLSLAIGKEGQNARLAARLTGYKVDIKAR